LVRSCEEDEAFDCALLQTKGCGTGMFRQVGKNKPWYELAGVAIRARDKIGSLAAIRETDF
jgi:hypothetical protein